MPAAPLEPFDDICDSSFGILATCHVIAIAPEGYFDPDQYPDCTVTLVSLNGTFSPKRIAVPEGKPIVFGRLPQDAQDLQMVPKFQSKVVSRQHCIFFSQNGKFFVKDAGSSAGTFLQNPKFGDRPYRLSEQGKESPVFELSDGDVVQLGEDYDQGGALHKCTLFRVSLPLTNTSSSNSSQYSASPGITSEAADSYDGGGSFIDYSADPDVRREVEDEFNSLWASLISPLMNLTPRGNSFTQRKASAEKKEEPTFNRDNRGTVTGIPPPSTPSPTTATAPTPANSAAGARPSGTPAVVDGVNPTECINFINSLTWETPGMQARLVELITSGDTHILGFYRSLKQFPSAFKDVVIKYLQKKTSA